MLEVADVVAGHDLAPLATAIVLFSSAPTASTVAAGGERQRHRLGRVAPGAAQHLGPGCGVGAHDRVVAADVDRPVVGEQPVDQRAEPGDGVVVVVGDRLVAEVAARHHERPADAGQQQVVQRGVGQHQAELGQAGRDAVGHRRAGRGAAPARSVAAATSSTRRHRASRSHSASRRVEVGDHHGERLVVAGLAPAQLGHGGRVGGVDGEVVAADALDGHDRAAAQRVDGSVERGVAAARTSARRSCAKASCGPQTGQALGWAWKRRSAGSSYSAWQAAHIVNPAIVVAGRSYGTDSTIV